MTTETPEPKKAKTQKARVLVDHQEHRANDVIDVDAGSHEPWFDTDPKAVAYAEGLKS